MIWLKNLRAVRYRTFQQRYVRDFVRMFWSGFHDDFQVGGEDWRMYDFYLVQKDVFFIAFYVTGFHYLRPAVLAAIDAWTHAGARVSRAARKRAHTWAAGAAALAYTLSCLAGAYFHGRNDLAFIQSFSYWHQRPPLRACWMASS